MDGFRSRRSYKVASLLTYNYNLRDSPLAYSYTTENPFDLPTKRDGNPKQHTSCFTPLRQRTHRMNAGIQVFGHVIRTPETWIVATVVQLFNIKRE